MKILRLTDIENEQSIYRNVIYNDSSYSLDNFSMKDIIFGDMVNPGNWKTWKTNLSGLKKSGAKILSYHGTADGVKFHHLRSLAVN